MEPREWVPFGIFVLVIAGATLRLPRIWRHEAPYFDRVPGWWIWGDALWRGWVRALPTGVGLGWYLILGYVLLISVIPQTPEKGRFGMIIPAWFGLPFLFLFGLGFGVMAAIALFNRPKVLVPPHPRDEPGAVAEWIHGPAGGVRGR
jgi:hypothetical protein